MTFVDEFYDKVHLVAIDPMGIEDILADNFIDFEKAKKWAKKQNDNGKNIYFTVNEVKSKKKKATKNDVTSIVALWVDLDPDKSKDRIKERKRLKKLIDNIELKPSLVIDSGNGYAVYWYLKHILPNNTANMELAEDLNIGLAQKLGGDACHNIDRIMRYPDTINYPTPTKVRAGYKQSKAKELSKSDVRYTTEQINEWIGARRRKQIEVTDDKLNILLKNDKKIKDFWEGTPTKTQKDTSRSGMDFTLVSLLKSRGLTDKETYSALGIFEHGRLGLSKSPEKYFKMMWDQTKAEQPLVFVAGASVLVERYAYIKDQDKYYDGQAGIFITPVVLNNINIRDFPGNKHGPSAHAAFLLDESAIIADTITWWPNRDRLLKEENSFKLNMYVQPTMEPIYDENINMWTDHLKYLIPSEEQREHLMDWMAYTIKYPENKINHQILMAGIPRIGKDLLFTPIVDYLGHHNVSNPQAEQMHTAFNEFLNNKKLIMVEEIMNFEKRAYENQLKPLCASPPKYLHINVKGLRQYEIPNLVNIVFFSNEPDAISIRTKGDTRYYCLWCGCLPRTPQYYIDFVAWCDNGGSQRVVGFLMKRDLSKFNHGGGAPETEYRKEIGYMSLSGAELALSEAVGSYDGVFQYDLVTSRQVVEELRDEGIKNVSRAGILLKKMGAIKFECVYKEDGRSKKIIVWAVRNIDRYKVIYKDEGPKKLVDIMKNSF